MVKNDAIVLVARAYVALFAISFAILGIIMIVEPGFGQSDPPYRETSDVLPGALRDLAIAAVALAAARGTRRRASRWLVALTLAVGALWSSYTMIAIATRHPILGAVATIVMTLPFYMGPLCVGLWLCGRMSNSAGSPSGEMKAIA